LNVTNSSHEEDIEKDIPMDPRNIIDLRSPSVLCFEYNADEINLECFKERFSRFARRPIGELRSTEGT